MPSTIRRHKKTIIATAVAVLLVLALGAWRFSGSSWLAPKKLIDNNNIAGLSDGWKIANGNIGYNDGKKTLSDELSKSSDAAGKAQIYLQLSQLASNSGKNDESLNYALQADSVNPTNVTASVVADCYGVLNNKPMSVKYYNLAIERANSLPDSDSKTYFINETKDSLNSLGAN